MKIINACKNKLAIFATGALACLEVAVAVPAVSGNALPELVFVSDRDGSGQHALTTDDQGNTSLAQHSSPH
jgi:hypothetical protein